MVQRYFSPSSELQKLD